ncbi:thiamine pyrophosphate-dependent dehydrogenase E1 component subunit alpha [Nonomuraea sp. NBC_01738]|uniref:thiamine pyrophosphate-dependent dehydrogenase E1 component subunit alpha n=1 Tax=Nonomuraea sp. NBC_01738 TaxID=2976003 RepID=UPI002E168954|nr:thiamine pyrophosphate-dependent dehydrogenase E1 component subunit alpha [Nonomuraea sp. NBC_01738]
MTRTAETATELLGAEVADLELMLLIRHFEWNLLDLFAAGELSGTTHTCLGQEHIPVALRPLLREQDFVFSNHRGHGHYLARFGDPAGLLAEITGRRGAVCEGVGGSQHVLREGYLSTGIQGESLPVAVGLALHLSRTTPGALAVAHIGDGTWGEGAVYEALNLAALWRLPLLVVVENNGIAQSTPAKAHLAGSVAGRAAAFGIDHVLVTATHLGRIRDTLGPPLDAARSGPGPLVVEFMTDRLGPHSKGDDTRPPAEIAAAYDWYTAAADDQFRALDRRQRETVAAITREVMSRPGTLWPDRSCR